jgi:hypothetical protein
MEGSKSNSVHSEQVESESAQHQRPLAFQVGRESKKKLIPRYVTIRFLEKNGSVLLLTLQVYPRAWATCSIKVYGAFSGKKVCGY